MDRSNHYESSFEAYLQAQGLCYVAIDETKRSSIGEESVKNLDFVVYGPQGARLLIEIKGRRFPGGPPEKPRKVWECWCHLDDIDSLVRWQLQFGPGYSSLLVFNFNLQPGVAPPLYPGDLWSWKGQRYFFRAILVDDYQQHMRQRSPKWGTVSLPEVKFRSLARSFHYFTHHFNRELVEQPTPF